MKSNRQVVFYHDLRGTSLNVEMLVIFVLNEKSKLMKTKKMKMKKKKDFISVSFYYK